LADVLECSKTKKNAYMKLKSERTRGENVKRLVAGVLTVTALLLGLLPGQALASEEPEKLWTWRNVDYKKLPILRRNTG